MFRFSKFAIVFLALLVVSVGCLDRNNPNDPQNAAPEIPQLILFHGPSGNGVPEALQNSIEEFNANMATGYTYLSIATITSPDANDNRYVWQVSAGGFTAVIEAVKQEDDTVEWTVTISGSDANHSYDNWVALRGTSNMEGTEGEWHIFEENSTNEVGVFVWSVDDHGVKHGQFTAHSGDVVYEITNNPDGSGSFVKKVNGVKVYEAIWDASGAGSWTSWDTNGNVIDSGNWT